VKSLQSYRPPILKYHLEEALPKTLLQHAVRYYVVSPCGSISKNLQILPFSKLGPDVALIFSEVLNGASIK